MNDLPSINKKTLPLIKPVHPNTDIAITANEKINSGLRNPLLQITSNNIKNKYADFDELHNANYE